MNTQKIGILVINSGSTSLKFAVYIPLNNQIKLIASGGFAGMPHNSTFNIKNSEGNTIFSVQLMNQQVDHEIALQILLEQLQQSYSELPIKYAGHRIVHGGERFSEATKLDNQSIDYLASLSNFEPTHQHYQVMGAKILAKRFPQIQQSATFDTSFHRSMPQVAEFYPVSTKISDLGVRHWGFHGISYSYISLQLEQHLPELKKVIVAHLGGGASLCAMLNRKSIDTSMQFGGITGIPMATRAGDFPADAIFYLLRNNLFSIDSLEQELAKHSGLLGASGRISEHMHILEQSDDPKAQQALEYFKYALQKYIGAYIAALEGIDALIFTAGIGENSSIFRSQICDKFTWMGLQLDALANQN
ncbi:MAG: hypothetical protein RLZZ293_543, partial [Pseudomonadota bacterium]